MAERRGVANNIEWREHRKSRNLTPETRYPTPKTQHPNPAFLLR